MSRRSSPRLAAVALLALGGLAGCFTGARPRLSERPAPTGDAATDAVLERLDRAGAATFTATYSLMTKRQPAATTLGAVAQDGRSLRSITIGDVRYVVTPNESVTCGTVAPVACTDSIDEARVSDLQVNSDFYGASQAGRLRGDVRSRVGPTVGSTEPIAGQTATCVAIPVAETRSTYCALDSGVLARLDAPDVSIELTGYGATAPSPGQFAIPTER